MLSFLVIAGSSVVLIGVSALIFYEVLALLWVQLHRLEGRPRTQTLLALFSNFAVHTLSVWLYGAVFYGLHRLGYGNLTGLTNQHFMEYIYYSGGAYSSLGLDNVGVDGALPLLTVVESVMGLIFIGWTVGFSFIFMQKYLHLRHDPRKKPRND